MTEMKDKIQDEHIVEFEPLQTPEALINSEPASETILNVVQSARQGLRSALDGKDNHFVVIVGPCSIHDPASAIEYAQRLAALNQKVSDRMLILMRVYFEKPRTTVGWKGFIYDPDRDNSNDMNRGLVEARRILMQINELGLPCVTEFLDPIVPQYVADLVAWVAIGARTTESQTHRQMASGLSMPVGFKNSTDGSLQVAIDAMSAASHSHAFLGINSQGQSCVVRTTGNEDTHIVLRGGGGKSNYSRADIAYTQVLMEEANARLRPILVDCSHANSNKNFAQQPLVFESVLGQFLGGTKSILGVMLESHLIEGRQALSENLTYGQSITDGCIGWEKTEEIILKAHALLGE